MNWVLLIALLPVAASAPSPFTFQGYTSEANCERARTAVVERHHPFGKHVILWAMCVPGNEAAAEPDKH